MTLPAKNYLPKLVRTRFTEHVMILMLLSTMAAYPSVYIVASLVLMNPYSKHYPSLKEQS